MQYWIEKIIFLIVSVCVALKLEEKLKGYVKKLFF